VLLVFDNFEHLIVEERTATAATEFMLALLQAAPSAILVMTSRLPLQLLAETVIRLRGLPTPAGAAKLEKRAAANYESIRLFVYHVQRALPDFTLSDDNLAAVVDLCRALSGMPLAIELAAALTPHFTPSELVAAIRQNLDLLVAQRRDLDVRHRQVSAVLESSWQLLTAQEQAILAQSSIFVGRFSRAAAQAVTGATVTELASLVDKSLIQQLGVGLYQLHELLRQFAADKLHSSAPEASSVADRHSAYYLNFVAGRERMLTRNQPRQAIEEIQREVDNVRQAWAWTVAHIGQLPLTAAIGNRLEASAYAFWHFYLITGLFAEGVATFQQASAGVQAALETLATPPTTEDNTRAIMHRWQQLLSKLLALEAWMYSTYGYFTKVLALAQRAIAIGAAYGDIASEVIGLLAVTQAHYHNGTPAEAQAAAERLLQLIHQVAWVNGSAEYYYDVQLNAYLYLGAIALYHDNYEQTHSQLTQALQLCQSLDKLRGEMHVRHNLANLARWQHNYAAARPEYQQALQIACELGYRRGEAAVRHELADVLRGLGDYSSALAQFALALSTSREIGDQSRENYAQIDASCLYAYLGDFAQARTLIDEALRRSEPLSMLDEKLHALLAVATLHGVAGEASETLHYATRCHQVAHEHSSRGYEGRALLYMGSAFANLGRWTEAGVAYANALALYQQLDTPPMVAEAQAGLARVALAQDDPAAALVQVEKILAILSDHTTVGLDEPFQIYLTCYHVLTANNDARNTAILQTAHELLQTYASHLPDEALRRSFLENVAVHREAQQLYESWRAAQIPA
jgi:predicted ATPase